MLPSGDIWGSNRSMTWKYYRVGTEGVHLNKLNLLAKQEVFKELRKIPEHGPTKNEAYPSGPDVKFFFARKHNTINLYSSAQNPRFLGDL